MFSGHDSAEGTNAVFTVHNNQRDCLCLCIRLVLHAFTAIGHLQTVFFAYMFEEIGQWITTYPYSVDTDKIMSFRLLFG